MKTCPLCGKELISEGTKDNPDINFICSEKINIWPDTTITHYRLIPNAIHLEKEIIFILPFRLNLIGDKYFLYKKGTYTQSYCTWNTVASFPKFEIKSEQIFLNRIKKLIIFS